MLKRYAEAFEANLAGWSFLAGERAAVLDVAHRYGVAVAKAADGQVDHTMLTMLIDRQGTMRVHISAIGSIRRVPPRPPEPHERALMHHPVSRLAARSCLRSPSSARPESG
jgi:SCO1/SenC